MDEKLYYEADVKFGNELKDVYDEAVARNVKFYRGVSTSGNYFGWDDGKYVKAEGGQEWFENPNYKEFEPVENQPLDSVDIVDNEKKDNTSEDQQIPEESQAEENASDDQSRLDFEARIVELEKLLANKSAELEEKTALLSADEEKLAEIKHAVSVVIDFIKRV